MVTLTISFPDDKREALEHFLGETGGKIEVCLAESMEDWYRKTVPVGVRKYLDAKWEKECGAPPEPLKAPAPEPEGSTDAPSWEGLTGGESGACGPTRRGNGRRAFPVRASIAFVYTVVYTTVYTNTTG